VPTAVGMQRSTHRPRSWSAGLAAGVVPFLRAQWRPWRFVCWPPSLSSSGDDTVTSHLHPRTALASRVARPPNTPQRHRPTHRCCQLASLRGPDAIANISAPLLTLLDWTVRKRSLCARLAAAHTPAGTPPATWTTSGSASSAATGRPPWRKRR
jgi:hypothetical protein